MCLLCTPLDMRLCVCVCVQESNASIAGDELLADMLQQMEVRSDLISTCGDMSTFAPTEPTILQY